MARRPEMLSIVSRLGAMQWGLVLLLIAVAAVGVVLLYSAAGGKYDPWATRQIGRFAIAFLIMLAVAVTDLRLWLRYAYVIYAISIVMLIAVDVVGILSKGAERWLNLGVIRLQPSEVAKIALVLALARYFHKSNFDDVKRPIRLVVPTLMILVPVGLVLKQPDLGTAVILLVVGAVMFYMAGVKLWKFAVVLAAAAAAIPVAWHYLRDYQKQRLLTFMDPETDPLGTGYHIIQSKIAFGSGGVFGKGLLQGTQIHLNFLPEMHTDFILSILAEEWGLVGGLILLCLYGLIVWYGIVASLRSRNQFGRLLAIGVTFTFFLYVFINMGMVMGLLPVVGVPLPLVSYGGTSMMTLMFGFGLILSIHTHREAKIGRFDNES
ncbi:MAG: rod shape-determining protein RodA [Alphaproteobacteria bacterium]